MVVEYYRTVFTQTGELNYLKHALTKADLFTEQDVIEGTK